MNRGQKVKNKWFYCLLGKREKGGRGRDVENEREKEWGGGEREGER